MIRIAVLAALAAAAASPVLAMEVQQVARPQVTAHFANYSMFTNMMSASTSEEYRMRDSDAPAPKNTVIYDLSKGKPADRVDVNSTRDNPFMAQPERESKPAQ